MPSNPSMPTPDTAPPIQLTIGWNVLNDSASASVTPEL